MPLKGLLTQNLTFDATEDRQVSETVGRLLCRMGFHRWKLIGHSLFGDPAHMCTRPYCRTCRQFFLAGAATYWQRDERLEGDKHHDFYVAKVGVSKEAMIDAISTLRAQLLTSSRTIPVTPQPQEGGTVCGQCGRRLINNAEVCGHSAQSSAGMATPQPQLDHIEGKGD